MNAVVMKKIITFIIFIFLTLNLLVSPFYFLKIREKSTWLTHKSEFKKKMFVIDSVILREGAAGSNANHSSTSPNTSLYYFYYDNEKFISAQDNSGALFHSKSNVIRTNNILKYIKQHNDSLLIWCHPTLNGQPALPEETEMNTNGFLTQVIINSILFIVAICSLGWLIVKIKNKDNKPKSNLKNK